MLYVTMRRQNDTTRNEAARLGKTRQYQEAEPSPTQRYQAAMRNTT